VTSSDRAGGSRYSHAMEARGTGERAAGLGRVALVVGALPTFGNAAYPLQLLAASTRRHGEAAPFLVHDIFSATGRRLPVWGGRDTLLEHRANAIATFFARRQEDHLRRK